jgi:membrane dipeptidase
MSKLTPTRTIATLAVIIATFCLVFLLAAQAQQGNTLAARARSIHDRVIKIDTHNDIDPRLFTPECNYTMRLTTQVNLPKMNEGDMDVSFMIVYVEQGPLTAEGYDNAYRQAIAKFDAIHRLTENIAPEKIALARTPADVVELHRKGMRIAVIGIENGYPMGLEIRRLKEFYDRGGRYMSLAHNGNSQLSDSNTGERAGYIHNNGLSELGREVIAEMNRLGIMIDVSHPSKGSMIETVKLSKAPIIASHSSVRALANVSRNMDDEQLLALKKNGGVIQIVGLASYLKTDSAERTAALAKLRQEFGIGGGNRGPGDAVNPPPCPVETPNNSAADRGNRGGGGAGNADLDALSPEKRPEYEKRLAEIDAKMPAVRRAGVNDLIDHIDYAVKLIGIDHVGISSDFDGGGGIDGWDSAAEAFNVTLELVRRGYTEQQIGKLWGGNLLRVWREVEKVSRDLQKK